MEEPQKDKKKLAQVIISIVLVFVFAILIVIKVQSQTFPLGWVIFGFFALVLGLFATWKGADIYLRLKESDELKNKKGELPPAITLEQARELIEKQLSGPQYADYTNGWAQHKVYVVGKGLKQQVLLVQLEPTEYSSKPYQWFIINMHYPSTLWGYIEQETLNIGDLMKTVNMMVTDPEDEPDIKVTEEESPLTGIKRRIIEKTAKKEKEKKDVEKEEVKE